MCTSSSSPARLLFLLPLLACGTPEPLAVDPAPPSPTIAPYPAGERHHAAGHDEQAPVGTEGLHLSELSFLCDAGGWHFDARPSQPVLAGSIAIGNEDVWSWHSFSTEIGSTLEPGRPRRTVLVGGAVVVPPDADPHDESLVAPLLTPVTCGPLDDRWFVVRLQSADPDVGSMCVHFGGQEPEPAMARDCTDWTGNFTYVLP